MGNSLTTTVRLAIKGDSKGAVNSLREFNRSVGGAESQMGKWGAAAAVAGAAVAAGIGLAIGAIYKAGRALYDLGAQWDDTFDAIRIGTGATGKSLKGLERDAKAIAMNTASPLKQIGVAVATLNTRLGLTGKPLQKLSKQFLDFSRLTGGDVHEDIRSLTRLFGDWSIKAEDYSDALDMVFRTAQATDIGIQDLTVTVVDNGATLRQMGYSFEESITMLGKWEMEGVNVSKMIVGLNQANKYFTKENKDAAAGLREVIEQIRNANEIEGKAIAVKVFGVRAAADMTAAIREERFEWEDLQKNITDGADTVAKATQDTMSLPERWQIFRNKMAVKLQPIASKIFDYVEDQFDRIAAWVDEHGDDFVIFFENAVKAAKPFVTVLEGILQLAADVAEEMFGEKIIKAEKLLNDRLAKSFWFDLPKWRASHNAINDVIDAMDIDPSVITSLDDANDATSALSDALLKVDSLEARDLIDPKEADAARHVLTKLKQDMVKRFIELSTEAGKTGKKTWRNLKDPLSGPLPDLKSPKIKGAKEAGEKAREEIAKELAKEIGANIKLNLSFGTGAGISGAGLGGMVSGMRAVSFAKAQLGDAYRVGATGPDVWDCSGLMMGAYRAAGLHGFPTYTGNQWVLGRQVDKNALLPGDQIFMRTGNPKYTDAFGWGHTGIYIGNGQMIHASGSRTGVITSPVGAGYPWAARRHFAAAGADFMTAGPTLILAGEAGREHVKVTPAPKNGIGGDGVSLHLTVNVAGSVYTDNLDEIVSGAAFDAVSAAMSDAEADTSRYVRGMA